MSFSNAGGVALYRLGEQRSTVRREHQIKLDHFGAEVDRLRGCANQIIQIIEEAKKTGAVIAIQPQINFITGTYARLVKDWAVLEHLQSVRAAGGK